MSPTAIVTGLGSPILSATYIAELGEVDEHARAAWRNTIVTVSDMIVLNQKYGGKYSLDSLAALLIDRLRMPDNIARELVLRGISHEKGFAVNCVTVFEQEGRIGGPRRFENFYIK